MKQKLIPIISIVIGLLAFILTKMYLQGQQDRYNKEIEKMYAGAKRIEIIVAFTEIPAGTAIKQTDIRSDTVIESSVPPDVVSVNDADKILGKKLLFRVTKGRAISWGNIEGVDRMADLRLAGIVKPGLRAMSLSIGGASAVSSMVQPNDRVDVLGTFSFPSKKNPNEMETVTLTVLQDVTVLATGQNTARQYSRQRAGAAMNYSTVTLEVTPREAELLLFAQQMRGGLSLTLRNPSDVSFENDLPEIDFKHLETRLPELNLYRQRTIRHKTNL